MKTSPLYTCLLVALAAASAAAAQRLDVKTQWHFEQDGARPGDVIRAAIEVHIPDNFHVHSNTPNEEFLIPTQLTVTPPEGFEVLGIAYPDAIEIEADFSEIPLAVFEEEFLIGVALQVPEDTAPGDYTVSTKLRYQACDDKQCLPPVNKREELSIQVVEPGEEPAALNEDIFARIDFTGAAPVEVIETPAIEAPAPMAEDCDVVLALDDFEIVATTGGFLKPDEFIQFVDDAEAGRTGGTLLDRLAEAGPIAMVALVLIGGLGLNLTPCVLPLIPINLAIIGAGAQSESRTRGFLLGAAYGLAMAVVYGALGLIVILTGSQFGVINSTIWFNAGIAVLFVALGLAMFDVIQIDFSKFQSKFNLAQSGKKGSLPLAFGMGGVAALLAGACVAPIVIAVILYAGDLYMEGNRVALALPFLLGVGMAIPWPMAGAGMSVLPKPGAWMVRVKQAMGVFILGFAAYYGYLAYEIWDQRNVDPAAVAGAVEEQLEGGWTASMCGGMATAQAEERYVLVDMWATWCKNCLVMDKTTFKDDAVVARLEDFVKVKFQAEDPTASPAAEMMELFDGVGLPTYAILRPKSMAPPAVEGAVE